MANIARAVENIFLILVGIGMMISWAAGIIISSSAWAIIPLYAWYVVIERTMLYYHILGVGLK